METFSPVIKFDNLRAILAFAAENGWHLFALDLTQACLNAPITEEIWIRLPGNKVIKLQRALYGLKQAGLAWVRTYTDVILQ